MDTDSWGCIDGIRIARIFSSGYKLDVMLTFLMIAASIWGTDPGIVFSGDCAPWTAGNVRPAVLTSDSSNSFSFKRINRRSSEGPMIVRGQTVSDDAPVYSNEPVVNDFWHEPIIKDFITGMNPFVPHEFRTLKGYYDPFGSQMGTGTCGPPGYRLGWVSYNDFTSIPYSPARGTTGSMQILQWNSNLKYSSVIAPGVLFNGTGYFNAQWWNGPGGTSVPGQVDQISTDLELGFFDDGPWSAQIAFHPQIVDTYDAPLDRNAFNFDGRAIATYKASPQWSFVGGVAIWDRLDVMVVPHAGVIWTPNDRWEVRLLYPRSRISYLLGKWGDGDVWIYGQAEYTAQTWQSYDKNTSASDRIQFTDDRLSLGLQWDTGRYSLFAEAGYVFNRRVQFASSTPGFDLDNSVMFRTGLRY